MTLNWKKKQVLVTGAGGFIGSHLCEVLVQLGAEVTAMIRYSGRSDWGDLEYLHSSEKAALKVVAGNIEDSDFVSRLVQPQDIVFHLAALIGIPFSYVSPRSYVRTNIEGTLNILEAVRKSQVEKLVHTSTSETYGTALYTPIDEKHPLQGQSPYSATKIAADKMTESYFRSFNIPVVTIRPFNTFGPRQSARAVIPTIITQALTQPEIRLGSLDPIRDLNYVKDVVQAFIRVAEADAAVGQTLNVGSGQGVTIGELARQILSHIGEDKPIVQEEQRLRPTGSEVYTLICDSSRIRKLTGWSPAFSLNDGLAATAEFVSSNLGHYKAVGYTI